MGFNSGFKGLNNTTFRPQFIYGVRQLQNRHGPSSSTSLTDCSFLPRLDMKYSSRGSYPPPKHVCKSMREI